MEGVLRFQGRRNYFVLWRTKLYHWRKRPEKQRLSTAWEVYLLSTLENLETDPSQRHVLILKFPQGRIELAANNPGSYQAWLSCFAVFHVRNSLNRKAPYLVSSTYMKAIWAVLDDVHWRGCQTRSIFLSYGNEQNVEILKHKLLTKGPGSVDPQDYNVTTVATVVRILLDSLPESLWTEQAFNELRDNNDVNSLRFVIASLPEQNSELLKKLFITLSSVTTNELKSKVSVDDLAKVMTPTLDSREDPLGSRLENVTKLCISEYQHLFFGVPLMVVVVPKIEDILTYKRTDFRNKKRRKRYQVTQPRGSYREEPMPQHKEFIITDVKTAPLQLSSDDESSSSHSQHSLRHMNFLRPQFKSEYSPKKPKEAAFASPMILSDLPEIGPMPEISDMSQSMLNLAASIDSKIDEKSSDDKDSSPSLQSLRLLVLPKGILKKPNRARSLSVNLLDPNMTGESSDQYSSRNIREVVGKRRAANTRLVKSLATDSFFVYAYLSDDDRSLNIDGLFPTKPKRQSLRRRIQVPIAEDEEYENYQKDLIEQNKNTEFLEVFGPSQTSAPILPSLLKKSMTT